MTRDPGPSVPAVPLGAAGTPASGAPTVERTVLGWSTGLADILDAEHALTVLPGLPAGAVVCTHLVRFADLDAADVADGAGPHVAASVDVPGGLDRTVVDAVVRGAGGPVLEVVLLDDGGIEVSDPDAAGGPRLAVSQALVHAGGRAVVFPGCELLHGHVTVAELLDRTAVDVVRGLGDLAVTDTDVLWTRDFIRPVYSGGRLVLDVAAAVDGVLVGFEDPFPTYCCAVHAPRSRAG